MLRNLLLYRELLTEAVSPTPLPVLETTGQKPRQPRAIPWAELKPQLQALQDELCSQKFLDERELGTEVLRRRLLELRQRIRVSFGRILGDRW
jgi:hypothetical protein